MDIEKKAQELHEEFVKLLADERKANDTKLEGRLPAGDFKTFESKIEARMAEINTELAKLKVPALKVESKDEPDGKAEYKKAFFNFMRTDRMELNEKARAYQIERKALVEDATGQIIVPEEVEAEVYRTLPQINVIRPLCSVRTITRDRIRLRGVNEVQVGWGKLELGGAAPETTLVPQEIYQYAEDLEGLTKIGKDELMDTDVALEPIVANSFSRAMADAEEAAFIVGTGHANQQPQGFLLAAAGVPTHALTAAGAVTTDDILDLIYTVPSKYRKPTSTFVMHSGTEHLLRLLRANTYDATHWGGYIWQPSVQAGAPATLHGYPVVISDSMPQVGDGLLQRVVAFGDFKAGYRIVDRVGMTIQRLSELYATAGLVGFLASRRVGGSVLDPNALAILIEP